MRGEDERSGALFSYVDLEARVGKDRPLRTIRPIANEALTALAGDFSALYSRTGRPSIPPEMLLRAMLLQAFYSIRSERQLMERLEFDLLFRWFVGIGIDDAAWDHSTFSKNRDRLLEGDIAAKLLSAVLVQPRMKRLLSTDHFSVDGTLPEAPRCYFLWNHVYGVYHTIRNHRELGPIALMARDNLVHRRLASVSMISLASDLRLVDRI
jgi:transposase